VPSPADPLRVLMVCQNDLDGASEKQALWFGRELVRSGHRVFLSLHGDPETAQREGALGIEGLDVRFHRFRGRTLRRSDLAAARAFEPTLIHAFNARVPVATATRAYARAINAPIFVHWEDDEWSISARVHSRSLVRRLGTYGRNIASPIYPPVGPYVTRGTVRWAQYVAGHDALTPALAARVQERLHRACQVVLPIAPNVHEPPPLPSERLKDLRGREILMITGHVHGGSIADLEMTLRATALLRQRGRDAVFVHAGRVMPRFDVDAKVAEAGLTSADARFLGYLPFPDIPPLLREADVLLQPGAPSQFNRLRLPSKVQAYLASGVPTVTFAVGFAELLEDRVEVLKLQHYDATELADSVVAVLEDRGLRRRLSEGGRHAARRLFDPVTNGAALVSHFRAGLEASRKQNGQSKPEPPATAGR
jgi:glycosyltransferase involved in cell wall biosynthesis